MTSCRLLKDAGPSVGSSVFPTYLLNRVKGFSLSQLVLDDKEPRNSFFHRIHLLVRKSCGLDRRRRKCFDVYMPDFTMKKRLETYFKEDLIKYRKFFSGLQGISDGLVTTFGQDAKKNPRNYH